jgi:hypothetical protein
MGQTRENRYRQRPGKSEKGFQLPEVVSRVVDHDGNPSSMEGLLPRGPFRGTCGLCRHDDTWHRGRRSWKG